MAGIKANINDPQQDIEPIESLSREAIQALMDSDDKVRELLQALATTYGVKKAWKLPIDQDLADKLPLFASKFDITTKGMFSKDTILSSNDPNEKGKQFHITKDSITFVDNDAVFSMRDGHEMALLATLNPEFGKTPALYLEGSSREKYILMLNCKHLGINVRPESIADIQLSATERTQLDAEHAELKKDLLQEKAELLVKKLKNESTLAQETISTLKNSSLNNFEKNHNAARRTQNDVQDKIEEVKTFLKDNKDNLTNTKTLSEDLSAIEQNAAAHKVILDNFEPQINSAKKALILMDTTDTAVDKLGTALRNATDQAENIDIALRKGHLDEAEALLSNIDETIKTAKDAVQPAQDAIELITKNANASTLPAFLENDLTASLNDVQDVIEQHQIVLDGVEEQSFLQNNSLVFKKDWQAAETNFKALEADVTPNWYQKLRPGTLHSTMKKLENYKNEISADNNFSVENEDHRQALIQKTNDMFVENFDKTDKNGDKLRDSYSQASKVLHRAKDIDFPEHTASQLTDISTRVASVRNLFEKHVHNHQETIKSIETAPIKQPRQSTVNNNGGGAPVPIAP